jgi:glutamine---fructose-6-phosphate transaminase (isomerizing)
MSITSIEIATQPAMWARAISEVTSTGALLGKPGERVLYLGCGTSAFVAESLAWLRERAGLGETDAAYASEWQPGRSYDRVVAISRSGTTVTGVVDSPIADLVDDILLLDYADEESVVQTRFPTTVLTIAREAWGYDIGAIVAQGEAALAAPLPVSPTDFDHFVYLGTGWTYGLAQEAALKIREAAQAWSESYPLLDYRHGPIAVAHPGSLVWVFGEVEAELVADIEATGATVRTSTDDPIVELLQAQRLAVALAESRGLNPDTPRHLSRSVILQ